MRKLKVFAAVSLIISVLGLVGCSAGANKPSQSNQLAGVKLGYLPNITNAPAMVGLEKGLFQQDLGDIKLGTKQFPNGSLFMDALTTGQIDIGFVGPEPAINRYIQGGDVVVLSGVSNGGNLVVARKDSGVNSVKDLAGKTLATPARACTHDISIRILMQEQGLKMEDKGGNVKQVTQKPADMVTLFQQKQLDVAVVSEPWASQLEAKQGAKVIVDWDKMPWEGKLPGTILVASKKFVQEHPDVVKKVLKGNVDSVKYIQANPNDAMELTTKHIAKLTKEELPAEVVKKSFARTQMTYEIKEDILAQMVNHSKEMGLVTGKTDVAGLVDLTLLNEVLKQ
ncbi:MAG TPA: aliphatic sulfonate ABC transporter substrate-binding protein [Verrucomicrobiae bacterium]|nr:aliphatic sulfonate ABC transporter substrate-binding protein [Verrucomicrobiae bacterium]